MARELQDVLHYFLPDPAPVAAVSGAHRALLVSVPLTARDVVRPALLWNLAVEIARQGAAVALVTPRADACAPWPAPALGPGPLGVDVIEIETDRLAALADAALDAADRMTARSGRTAVVFAALPVAWLRRDADAAARLDQLLLLARPDEREWVENWAALAAVSEQAPLAKIGVSIFGVASPADGQRAFEGLAALAELELERSLTSYGVLIDDIHLSRSIVTQRPISLSQPASASARALADVAARLLEDAR